MLEALVVLVSISCTVVIVRLADALAWRVLSRGRAELPLAAAPATLYINVAGQGTLGYRQVDMQLSISGEDGPR